MTRPAFKADGRSSGVAMGSIPMTFRHDMPRKRRKFSAAKTVRAIARERLGTPPPARRIDDERKKQPKHKKKVMLEEGSG